VHNLKNHSPHNPESPGRLHQRKAFEVFAVVSGTYAAYKVIQHVGSGQRATTRRSSTSTSLWWSGVMFLLYRALRTAHESLPAPRWHHLPRSAPPVAGPVSQVSELAPHSAHTADRVTFPTRAANPGEHTQWLESFRSAQVHRLRTDPPADD